MDIFDIIGPVMIGPSSSHTAGVVRIGNITRRILDSEPKKINVKFHGSFATTYKGHGSDKAIVGGIMGFGTDDPRIRESLDIAKEKGIEVSFETIELRSAHPNTLLVEAAGENGAQTKVMGESIGGGNIIIRQIGDINVELSGDYDTIITIHKDEPGVVSIVTNLLATKQINIANMRVFRSSNAKGSDAIMVIETDSRLEKSLAGVISGLPSIERVSIISGGRA